jgi:hypothetical protein
VTICPSCNGPHLEGLRFQHKSICDFFETETQTQAADHARFRANHGRAVIRDATPTEILMLEVLGAAEELETDSAGKEQIYVSFHGAMWSRSTTDPYDKVPDEGHTTTEEN